MSTVDTIGSWPATQAAGWALLHFIWQGALVALATTILLKLMRRRSAASRYAVCCTAMFLMMAAPIVTFLGLYLGRVAPSQPLELAVSALSEGGPTAWQQITPYIANVTLVWLVGVCIFQLRMVWQWAGAQRLKNHGTRETSATWRRIVDETRGRLRIRRPVGILESSFARVPMLIGWLRPVVLMPTSALTGLSPDQLRAIIVHELGHVARHDYLVNLVQGVFESLLFYHPAVWWLSHRLRIEREYCCDDLVVNACGDRLCYARALCALDTARDETFEPALASTGGVLMNRIRRLAGLPTSKPPRMSGWLAPMMITAATIGACLTLNATAVDLVKDKDDQGEHFAPGARLVFEGPSAVDHVNIVNILKEFESELAPMIETLHDVGVDNETLLKVLESMSVEERVMKSIHHSMQVEHIVQRELRGTSAELAEAVAAGEITLERAQRHLERAGNEIRRDVRLERRRREHGLEDRLHAIELELEAQVKAGRITEAEASLRHEQAVRELRSRMDQMQERQAMEDKRAQAMEERMRGLHERMEAAVDAGRLTEAEAEERLRQARHELMTVGEQEMLERKLSELHRDVKAKIKAGEITESQGRDRLDAARREAHQHLELVHEEHARDEDTHARMRALHERIEAQVAAGRLSEQDAEKKLHAAHNEIMGWRDEEALKEQLRAMHREIELQVENGAITREEARDRLDIAEHDVHDRMEMMHRQRAMAREHPQHEMQRIEEHLQEVHTHIQREVAAGRMSKQQAEEHLRDARAELDAWNNKRITGPERDVRLEDEMRERVIHIEHKLQQAVEKGKLSEKEAAEHIRKVKREIDRHRAELKQRHRNELLHGERGHDAHEHGEGHDVDAHEHRDHEGRGHDHDDDHDHPDDDD